ncbi:hypothetical protein BST83_18450 [Polaribacter filamentus]|uniref:Uncharacterized protein n=1 Tax=Polaribacter filamentus TaxID=53483 RepID=A0A2S7KKZ8_9FLAO|nr:hypothetical protein BST83_18450 [Polaribacter filamentus]
MKIKILFSILILVITSIDEIHAQQLAKSGNHYSLKKILRVDGRQGIAVDKHYYVSSSVALYK